MRKTCIPKKTTPSSKTTIKDLKERKAADSRLLNFVPKWFKEKIACCATEAKEVYEYWKVAKHVTGRLFVGQVSDQEVPSAVELGVTEFYKAAKAANRGKFSMKNPYGFFHAVMNCEVGAYVRRQAANDGFPRYNWLER